MLIRDFVLGDEEAYARIYNETYETCSWYSEHGPISAEDVRKRVEKYRNFAAFKLLLAIIDDVPVGFITAMVYDEPSTGYIVQYEPCVLPIFRNQGVETKLVEAVIDHLRKNSARTMRYSIVGLPKDMMHHVDLFKKVGFKEWRLAQTMERSLETSIPDYSCTMPLKTLNATALGIESFVDFFIICFRSSRDRDASQIASNYKRAKQFIQRLYVDEADNHDPDLWFAVFNNDQFVGFTIARKENNEGHVAEVGVIPESRRKGIGNFLTVETLKRLKQKGAKRAFLGVDKENSEAIALYEKCGFEKKYEIVELERPATGP
jgi:ribosomal protein S18 acetylase RimI-like enzyme